MIRCGEITLILTLFFSAAEWIYSAPVEGNGELLQQLYEVQRTNETQHERGFLRARVTLQGTEEAELDIQLLWDRFGERRYWNYSGHTRGGANEFDGVEMIRVPDTLSTYNPGARFARHTSHRRSLDGYAMSLKLHPSERWYVFDMGQQLMHELLDPNALDSDLSYVVRQGANDRVIVERHRGGRKARVVTASLAHGGNIMHVKTDPEWAESADAFVRNAEYDWMSDGEGGWYPRRILLQHSHGNDPEAPFWSMQVDILEYDPHPRIPAGRFEFSSLSLADGTRVSVVDEQREKVRGWIVGREDESEVRADQKRLDELAEQLRESGFAAPEREQ